MAKNWFCLTPVLSPTNQVVTFTIPGEGFQGNNLPLFSIIPIPEKEWLLYEKSLKSNQQHGISRYFVIEKRARVIYAVEITNVNAYQHYTPEAKTSYLKAQQQGLILNEAQIRKMYKGE